MPLTDAKIRNAKAGAKPVKLTDSHGLYLEIRPSGSRLWRYRYRINGKENVVALGEYLNDKTRTGHVSLDEARRARDDARALVKRGLHPARHRKEQQVAQAAEAANTFELVAREWMAQKKARWSPSYAAKVKSFLEADVFSAVGNLPIRNVTAAHLLDILRRVSNRGAPTVALLLRQWCSAVFRYAVATLRSDGDPATALKGAISRPRTKHRKPLSRGEIVEFLKALESYGGERTTVIALRLALLTFTRPYKELAQAEWPEFDLDRASEWRIPGARMKLREPHIVPLSKQAVEVLRDLRRSAGDQRLLFPNTRRPETWMTATTLNRALERMGFNGKGTIGFSSHGFRATASTILNEEGYRPEVIERQLAHKERNRVRASYNQAEYLEERRLMMQKWADMIDEMVNETNKVSLRRVAI